MLVRDPIYSQLNQVLRDLIYGGAFQDGDRFLTERQVSERFAVSRATANKALSSLVSEGLLEFRKGVGTFVRGDLLDYDLRALVSFTEKARAAGKEPSTRVLRFETQAASDIAEPIRHLLALAPDESAYSMERLRLADSLPVILEYRTLRERFCPNLTAERVNGSLYGLLTDDYGIEVAGADETIRAITLHGMEAERLQTPDGAAGLLVTAIGFSTGETPLWYERTLYRGDAYEFRNRLGPVRTARPAAGFLQGHPTMGADGKGGRT